ncbi:MAG: hypothetical protein ACTSUE_25445 [Promethearchaeota archaeon]
MSEVEKKMGENVDSNIVEAPVIKKVVLFKHGIGFYGLQAIVKDDAMLKIQFKQKEMDDVLKSFFVADLSGNGFISTISYDAAENVLIMMGNLSVQLPGSKRLLEDFLADLKGARVNAILNDGSNVSGSVIGIENVEDLGEKWIHVMPELVLMQEINMNIIRIRFSDIQGIKILNEELQKDLDFFLDLVLSRKKKDAKNLVIHCVRDGDSSNERNIYLSYIQEIPIWKTSYRLVIPGDGETTMTTALPRGKGFLSGWGLVENQTPNDWEGIDLILVAGMPVTFSYPIYEPQFIKRKVVLLPKKSSIGPAAVEDASEGLIGLATEAATGGGSGGGRLKRAPALPPKKGGFGATFKDMKKALKESISVSSKDMGELFEYHIEKPVTIRRNQSALVPIVADDINATKILLYDKAIHELNPMACVEIKNTSGFTLESGPITIMIGDTLAGEAMLPFLNKDDTRLLNYALEQGVVILMDEKIEYREVHRLNFSGSYLYEHKFEDRIYEYKIRNKTKFKKVMYVDHPKLSGFKVHETAIKPKETTSKWRFKIELEPKKAYILKFTMRHEFSENYYLGNVNNSFIDDRVSVYVKNGFIEEKTKNLLEEIAKKNLEKSELEEKNDDLENEKNEMATDQERIRETLKVLSTTKMESELKERLVQKLSEQESRYDEIQEEQEQIAKKIDVITNNIQKLFNKLDTS